MSHMSKMSSALALAAVGFVFLNASIAFVAPGALAPKGAQATGFQSEAASESWDASSTSSFPVCSMALLATAAGLMAHGRTSKVARKALHGIKFPYSLQRDSHADLEYLNDVGYLPDGTPMNRAGNAINHPENIQPDPHTPGAPLPRAEFTNSVGYLPDGTPMNAAGNALNHPETMQPDMHAPGSPLPTSFYTADVGYLVDGTDLVTAGNNAVRAGAVPPAPAAASAPQQVAAAFVGVSTQASAPVRKAGGFAYAIQKDAYVDLEFGNDVGYLPDGTPMNRAGNAVNHPENIQPDPHAPGSPLPRAIFVNDVGYLPDGTPMNRAGNAINHPELLAKQAQVDQLNSDGSTALHAAAHQCEVEIVAYLLSRKSLVNTVDNEGWTPLMYAMNSPVAISDGPRPELGERKVQLDGVVGRKSTLELLLLHKADVNAQSVDGLSSLIIVCAHDRPHAAKQLIHAKAQVNMAGAKGQTAMLMAASNDLRLVAKALIMGNADVNQANAKGESPLSVSEQLGYRGVADLLKSAGALPPKGKKGKKGRK